MINNRVEQPELFQTQNVSDHTDATTSSINRTTGKSISHKTAAQRGEILRAMNWRSKRTSQSKTNWISPGLNIEFKLLRAAEEFNVLRRMCNGNENAAFEAYKKVIESRPQKASYFFVVGKPLLVDDNDDV